MSSERGSSRRGERKKAQIREAAYRCFRERGYGETSVDEICRRASCSKGSFYWYYSSKQDVAIDILRNWAREVITELLEQFEEAIQRQNPYDSITSALKKELHRGRAIVPLWLDFTVRASRDSEIGSYISKFFRRARTALVDLLSLLTGDALGDRELFALASAIFGAYIGLLVQEFADPKSFSAESVIDVFMELLESWLPMIPLDRELG